MAREAKVDSQSEGDGCGERQLSIFGLVRLVILVMQMQVHARASTQTLLVSLASGPALEQYSTSDVNQGSQCDFRKKGQPPTL